MKFKNLPPIASSRLGLEQAVFVGLFAAVGLVLVLPFGIGLLFRR
jgi:hypothetical protein